ncbi:MAG TPA: hypothetical protein VMG63_09405 [Terriglobia bacterium]|jgi:hypothetical protein|nr:hypothetical protein [Terriglobia bacterium]
MKRFGTFRNDLVIGMTLAEVFLLLLIVGWYGSRLESEEVGKEPLTPEEVLRKRLNERELQLKDANEERQRLAKRLGQLQEILDWLGAHLAFPGQIQNIASADAALRGYTLGLKRGKPTCQPQNVLVQIVTDNGTITLTVLQHLSVGDTAFEAGQSLAGEPQIEGFLSAVRNYYSQRRAANRDCAFDYTLTWRTDHDFRVAKKSFEPYFYPAGDRQLR